MEEEKNVRKNGIVFTSIICLILLIILGFTMLHKTKPNSISNDVIEEEFNNEIPKEVITEENASVPLWVRYASQEEKIQYVEEQILDALGENNSSRVNSRKYDFADGTTMKYFLYDIDGDGNVECILMKSFIDGCLTVYSKEENSLKELYNESIASPILAYIDLYAVEVISNEGNDTKIYIETGEADGLCYESLSLYELSFSGSKINLKNLFGYSCDNEEEERKREIIENNSNLTDEEMFTEIVDAHTLEYYIKEEKVSKEEYDKQKSEFKKKCVVLYKTSEYLDFFEE